MVSGPAPTGQHRTAPDSSGQLPNFGQLLGQLQLSKPSPCEARDPVKRTKYCELAQLAQECLALY